MAENEKETEENETQAEELAEVHAEAMLEFDNIQSALRNERLQCLKDRRFYSIAGAQWEGTLGEQFENKPKFEVNKIHLSVMRIINEYRNNRIAVDFVSKDGSKNDTLANTCDGLYRADEQDSGAEEAYDNAFEEAVGGGFGAWRLRAEYEDEYDDENEQQRIRIEPIYDADSSVYFDLNAKRQDKSDAKSCYVLTSMTKDAYESEYSDSISSWDKSVYQYEFDWASPEIVFVAEYYKIETKSETVRIFETLDGKEERYTEEELSNPEFELKLIATGSKEIRQKKVKRQKVHKYIMSGNKVLEDCGCIAGTQIPIVPTYGKRWFVDNIERCMGHVRLAKDPQRLKNMQLSKLGEISSLSSVEKPIFTPEQMAGHTQMWADDNIKDYPYMMVNPITDKEGNTSVSGPIGYTKPPAIPPALAALLQLTEVDMKEILGGHQVGERIASNISGEALGKIQDNLDMQTFIYMSNFAKAQKRSGEIWLSMAKELLVEDGRKMKTIGLQDEIGIIELNKPKIVEGEAILENNLAEAKFDVNVDVGPSFSNKKQATVNSLTEMMRVTTDPETAQVLSAMIMMNMDGEGIKDTKDYFRKKLIRMGVVKPNEEEAQELQEEISNTPKDPNSLYLEAEAMNAQAKAKKAEADTIKTLAQVEEIQAETAKTLSDMDINEQEQFLKTVQALMENGVGQEG